MSIVRSTRVHNNNTTSPDKKRVPPSAKDTQDFNRILEADEERERRQPRQTGTTPEQPKSTRK